MKKINIEEFVTKYYVDKAHINTSKSIRNIKYSYSTKVTILKLLNRALKKHKYHRILDDTDYSINLNNIDSNIIIAIKELSEKYDIIVGGSTMLKMYNLLDRDASDVDLIVNKKTRDSILEDFEVDISSNNSPYSSAKIQYKGIKFDILVNSNIDYTLYDNIKIDNIENTIRAKTKYNRNKDFDDFIIIIKKLLDIDILGNKI